MGLLKRLDEKRQRHAEEAKLVWAEVRKEQLHVRQKTERLRALRLAKEALQERKPSDQTGTE
jgi:hypothetical protein